MIHLASEILHLSAPIECEQINNVRMEMHLLSAVVLTFTLLCITIKLNAQSSECDSIVWNQNRKLVWEDFRGKPIDAARAAARSNYNFLHKWDVDKGMLTAGVVCIFSPCRSWSKNKSSQDLLKHEQAHFDMAEYFRRLYNKRILEERYTPQTLRLVTLKTYVDIQLECARLQDDYDEETNHGLKKQKQEEWLLRIEALLVSLKDFSSEQVTVKLR